MCYLVAKDINKRGSVAIKTQHGAELIAVKRELMQAKGMDRIQLVTISRPAAYGEYEPYKFVYNMSRFKEEVLAM